MNSPSGNAIDCSAASESIYFPNRQINKEREALIEISKISIIVKNNHHGRIFKKYINPFTDYGFQKWFGEEISKDLLLDF